MSNKLKMAKVHAIIGLLEQGWSHRRISREICVDRETVARYDRLRRAGPNPTIPTAGSERPLLLQDLLFSTACVLSPGRTSQCEPFSETIKSKLDKGLSAQRIFQDLTAEDGFSGSYSSVKRFVKRLGKNAPLPFRRISAAWSASRARRRR